jgi:hypothetical protein
MAAALLAVGFATARTCRAIGLDSFGIRGELLIRARRQVLAHDGAHESAGAHRGELEQTHLLAGQSHLRDWVIDDHAQFWVKAHLESIAAHNFISNQGDWAS